MSKTTTTSASALVHDKGFWDSITQAAAYKALVQELQAQYGFLVRMVTLPTGGVPRFAVRISTPVWVEGGDVDRLIDALQLLSNTLKAGGQSLQQAVEVVD